LFSPGPGPDDGVVPLMVTPSCRFNVARTLAGFDARPRQPQRCRQHNHYRSVGPSMWAAGANAVQNRPPEHVARSNGPLGTLNTTRCVCYVMICGAVERAT